MGEIKNDIHEVLWTWASETLVAWSLNESVPDLTDDGQHGSTCNIIRRALPFLMEGHHQQAIAELFSAPESRLCSVFAYHAPFVDHAALNVFTDSDDAPVYKASSIGSVPPKAARNPEPGKILTESWKRGLQEDFKRMNVPRTWWAHRALVMKHGSFLPAGNHPMARFRPFYVFVQMWIAIACAIEKAQDKETPFLRVTGDLSGIQPFLFSGTPSRMLRTMRSRSFFLEMLLRHVSLNIVREAGLPDESGILRCQGGTFSLLIPNTEANRVLLPRVKTVVNKWLLEDEQGFGGRIFMTLTWSGTGVLTMDHQAVIREIELQKHRRFIEQDALFARRPSAGTSQCTVCGTRKRLFPNQTVCGQCVCLAKVAARIGQGVKRIYPVFVQYDPAEPPDKAPAQGHRRLTFPWATGSSETPEAYGVSYFFDKDKLPATTVREKKILPVWVVNDIDAVVQTSTNIAAYPLLLETASILCRHVKHHPVLGRLVAQYKDELSGQGLVDKRADSDDFLASSEITARLALGDPKNALLKMDVDNLGYLQALAQFRKGHHILDQAALSWHLELFFKHFLNRICSKSGRDPKSPLYTDFLHPELRAGQPYYRATGLGLQQMKRAQETNTGVDPERPRVNLLYAGGDDLLIMGPWDEVMETAYDIQRAFKAYTGDMACWGISAGMVVQKNHGAPFSMLYENVSMALAAAKDPLLDYKVCLKQQCLGDRFQKCALYAMGHCRAKNGAALLFDPLIEKSGKALTDFYQQNKAVSPEESFSRMVNRACFPTLSREKPEQGESDPVHVLYEADELYEIAYALPLNPERPTYAESVSGGMIRTAARSLLEDYWMNHPNFRRRVRFFLRNLEKTGVRGMTAEDRRAIIQLMAPFLTREPVRTVNRMKPRKLAQWYMIIEWWHMMLRKSSDDD